MVSCKWGNIDLKTFSELSVLHMLIVEGCESLDVHAKECGEGGGGEDGAYVCDGQYFKLCRLDQKKKNRRECTMRTSFNTISHLYYGFPLSFIFCGWYCWYRNGYSEYNCLFAEISKGWLRLRFLFVMPRRAYSLSKCGKLLSFLKFIFILFKSIVKFSVGTHLIQRLLYSFSFFIVMFKCAMSLRNGIIRNHLFVHYKPFASI